MSARIHTLLLAAAIAIGAASCLTPTVPIPPPEPEKMAFQVDPDADTTRFTYEAFPSYSNAVVYVFNRDKGVGVITTAEADGSVLPTAPFGATVGDDIIVTFELDERLGTTCVTLQPGQSNSGLECSP